MLLELYVARHERKRVPVGSACMAGRTGQTTGLRCILSLEARGVVVRVPDDFDARRRSVQLTDRTLAAMDAYLAALPEPSPPTPQLGAWVL